MERFENYGILEDKEIYAHLDDGTYSIEHIMPQTLTPKWIAELGSDYEEIHETWLQMATFHAEWSKKFYDVFVPMLNEWNKS